MDFLNIYMPSSVELTQEELYDTRSRLEQYCLSAFPDVETNPNTVLGDLLVTPQSYTLTAIEKAITRFASDLDLGNVANGVIYNCDFVREWLKNFATDISASLRPSGVVRLVFNTNKQYVLDRGTQFSINDVIFSIYLPNIGDFTIYRPGETVPPGVNGTTLKDTGSGGYFADVPVVGAVAENPEEINIPAGTSVLLSVVIPELAEASALDDFDPGSETISLPDLAKRARTTSHAASLNTRYGAIMYMRSICPFIDGIYATHNGDREMLREYNNPMGVAVGCLDLYARSKGYNFTEVQTVTLYMNEGGDAYEGDFNYVGIPYHIESVTHTTVNSPNLEHHFTSTNDKGLGALAAYTVYEKLKLIVPDVKNAQGTSIFTSSIDTEGRRSAQFIVTYQTDPMLPAISQTAENDDYRPINSSILVRGFIPVIIDQFEVVYVKTPGVVPDLETARTKIKEYLGNLGAPDVYSDAVIAGIMGDAGVKYMKHVNVKAHVQWSIGDKIMDFKGNVGETLKDPEITSSAGLRIVYPAEDAVMEAGDMYACSVRNIRYWLMEGALTFNEVRDI